MSKQEAQKPTELPQTLNLSQSNENTDEMVFDPISHPKPEAEKKLSFSAYSNSNNNRQKASSQQLGLSSRQMETKPLIQESSSASDMVQRSQTKTFSSQFKDFFDSLRNGDQDQKESSKTARTGKNGGSVLNSQQAQQQSSSSKNNDSGGSGSSNQNLTQEMQIQQQQRDVIYESNLHRFKHIIYSKSRKILSLKEKERVYYFLKDPYHFVLKKPSHHRYTWLKCSGAYNAMLNSPGYYDELKNAKFSYPNPSIDQIEVDLRRTYPFDPQEKVDQYILPLRNVLITYVRRNPSGMYCQGMNSIAARLLCCMSEEEAFWTFAQIVECYLPLDYYSNLLGVLIDQKVMADLLQKHLPKLCQHFQTFEFNADLQIFKWLVQLFVGHLDTETEYVVWDLFFIKGSQVIFRVCLTIIEWLEPQILACDNFGDFYQLISKEPLKLDRKTLLERLNPNVSNVEIRNLRMRYKKETIKELRDTFCKNLVQQQKRSTSYPQMQFVQKFYLYRGLSQYFREQQPNSEKAQEYAKLMGLPMEKYEKALMRIFECNAQWPICLYDFSYKNKCPTYFCFRVAHDLTSYVIDDYFSINPDSVGQKLNIFRQNKVTLMSMTGIGVDELVIERNIHLCQCHQDFVKNFKARFDFQDFQLMQNPVLNYFFENDFEMDDMQWQFVIDVIQPLAQDKPKHDPLEERKDSLSDSEDSLTFEDDERDRPNYGLDYLKSQKQNIIDNPSDMRCGSITSLEQAVRLTIMNQQTNTKQNQNTQIGEKQFMLTPTAAAGALAFSDTDVDLNLPTIRRELPVDQVGMTQSPYNKLLQTQGALDFNELDMVEENKYVKMKTFNRKTAQGFSKESSQYDDLLIEFGNDSDAY